MAVLNKEYKDRLFSFLFGYPDNRKWTLSRSTLLKLPVPKLITFYNGKDDEPDEQILKLSDSFPEGSESDIEVSVRMLNINYGRNKKLLNACKPLKEYSWFIAEIRNNQSNMDTEHAVDKAINEMPYDFEIKPFLETHRAEVQGMLLTEYDETEAMELFREDGIREGMEKERKNTEAERERADAEHERAVKAEAEKDAAERARAEVEAELAKYKSKFGEIA